MREHQTLLSRRAFVGGSAAIFGTAILFSPAVAFATPSASDKKAEAEAAAAAAASKKAEAQDALVQLDALRDESDKAAADFVEAQMAQETAQTAMDNCANRIEEISGEIATVQGQLGDRARSMYRSGSLTFLDLLLGATSFSAFTQNWDLLNQMNENDAKLVQQTKDLKAEAEAQHEEFAKQEEIAAQKAAEAEENSKKADAAAAAMQQVYDGLSAEVSNLLAQEEAAREEADRLAHEEEVARMQWEAEEQRRREEQQASQNNSNNSNSGNSSNSGSSGSNSGNSGSSNSGGNPSGGSNSGGSSSSGGSNSSSGSSSGGSSSGGSSGGSYAGDKYPSPGQAAVNRAQAEIGKPYVRAGVGPDSYDCSGLVSYCITGKHQRVGTTYTFIGWPRVSNPVPGDICTNSTHCGIYIGGGNMIHAPQPGQNVKVGGVQYHKGMFFVRPPW
ncbi:coiled-coil domain-containing protein [Parvibacter caecicola]|uniref:coiled-coil domain-containing protein n=1 Tax=Parvibacter caecicola TaxID=747645 RepID=UPI001F15BD07|nr:NlpC/P60 family protein [Parvibacter caecicola]